MGTYDAILNSEELHPCQHLMQTESQNEAQEFCRGKRFNQCTLKLKNKPAWCACVYTPKALRLLHWRFKTTISLSPRSTEMGAAVGLLPTVTTEVLAHTKGSQWGRQTLPRACAVCWSVPTWLLCWEFKLSKKFSALPVPAVEQQIPGSD